MRGQIKNCIRAFLVENFAFRSGVDEIADDASLIKAGVLDSATMLTLISFLEEEYQIEVSDDEVEPENLESLETITEFVARKTGS